MDSDFSVIDRMPRVYLASAAGFLLLAAGVFGPLQITALRADFPAQRYPVKAVRELPESALAGHLFTDDEWGDYIIYSMYPRVKVFVDGRFDFYGAEHTQEYLDITAGKHDWERRLRKHGVDAVLLPVGSPLSSTLKESGRWIPVYDDGVAILFHGRERYARGSVPAKPGSAMDPGMRANGATNLRTARQLHTTEKERNN